MSATPKSKSRAKKPAPTPEKHRLNLPNKARPSRLLANGGWRPKLEHPYVMQVNGHRELVVTDSFTLGRFRVGENTPLGPIHREALKQIERGAKHDLRGDGRVEIKLDTKATAEYTAPAVDCLQPFDKLPSAEFPAKETVSVALNPQLLANVVAALGASVATAVRLDIKVSDGTTFSPIRVRSTSARDGDPEALLMPLRLVAP